MQSPISTSNQALLNQIIARKTTITDTMSSSTSTSAAALTPLPKDFLGGLPKDITPVITKIDFATTELPEYEGLYANVIDNVFTPAECEGLVRLAKASNSGVWERAMVNIGGGRQALYEDTRKCGRIILDSPNLAGRLWERVKPLVPELGVLEGQAEVTGWGPVKRGEIWRCTRLNERMRFLKYVGGEYFKREFFVFLFVGRFKLADEGSTL